LDKKSKYFQTKGGNRCSYKNINPHTLSFTIIRKQNFADANKRLENQEAQLLEASALVEQIKQNNLTSNISELLGKTPLGESIRSIREHLRILANQEEERTWMNTGLAQFADILRNKDSLDVNSLSDYILSSLIKYVGANQGGLYVLQSDDGKDEHLQMVACYAYDRKKHLQMKINLGEGLVGQCVLEKEAIYLKEVPKSFVNITSGLGDAPPTTVFISPLIINDRVFGALELASFSEFPKYKMEFIKRLAENIAASIKNVRESSRILTLLNSSQQQAEELRAQEEEMRQNMEELEATQEEIERKSKEMARTSAEMMSILTGINATMATIEFTPEGYIVTANNNFLTTMSYDLPQIKGKHHSMFVPAEVRATTAYETFWSDLALGKSFTGKFQRTDSKNNTVWLNAIYNPIFDSTGKVSKVVKFASDITGEQELLAERTGVFQGIDATMATIEFTPKGEVIFANTNFLKTMKCTLEQIKARHHKMFVPEDIQHSADYAGFWKRLERGEPISGVFKRRTLGGDIIWLNAIYNPIANANGKIVKVVKFATDISAAADLLAQAKQTVPSEKK
jgi:PAS domain S-box-containing protein